MRYKYAQFPLDLDMTGHAAHQSTGLLRGALEVCTHLQGPLKCLLDLHPLATDGPIKRPLNLSQLLIQSALLARRARCKSLAAADAWIYLRDFVESGR